MKPQFFITVFISFLLCSTPIWSQNNFISIEQDTTLAQKIFNRAIDLTNKAQYDSSNYYFEKASLIYEKAAIQNNEAKTWEKYVSCINLLGSNAVEQGKYENAMEYLNQSLEIGLNKLGENHIEISDTYNNIGSVFLRKGDYDRAFENYNKALSLRLQILGENHPKVANSYNNIGNIYYMKVNYDKALEYYNKSLNIKFRLLGEYNPEVADTYFNIGLIYDWKGDYDKAFEYYNKSLAIRLKVLGDNHPKVALSYNNIGIYYYLKGYFDKALEYYQRAIPIYIKSLGYTHPRIADCYNNIGIIHYEKGDFTEALEYYNKSLDIKIQILGTYHSSVANTYNNIGNIYIDKEDFDKALECYKKSLDIRLQTLADNDPEMIHSYYNIGRTYLDKGDYDKALDYFNKSLTTGFRSVGRKHFKVAKTYHQIGIVYSKKGDFDRAKDYYNQSLAVNLQLLGENHPSVAVTYESLGKLYYRHNNYEKALHYAQKSIMSLAPEFSNTNFYSNPSLKNIRSEKNLLSTLEFKAETLEKLYSLKSHNIEDVETSLLTYQLASDLIDKIRSGYKAVGSKLFLGERTYKIFDKAIRTSLKLYEITQNDKYKEQAFGFAEKAKSNVLLESLQESQAKQYAGIPDSVLDQERETRIDLGFYETQIQKELDKTDDRYSLRLKEFEAKHFTLNMQYQKLIEQIEKDYPKYYNLKYQTKSVSLSELQQSLDDRTALIEYFMGDSSIYIFTLSGDHFDVTEIEKDSSLHILAESLIKYIKQLDSKEFMATSYQLYNKLIHPIQHKLIAKEKLIIIPHGFLYKIPFETLIAQPAKLENEIKYLINRFETTYHYSATLYLNGLKATMDQVKDERFLFSGFAPVFRDEDKNNEILLANRSLLTDSTVRSFSIDGTRIDELPFSEKEVTAIIEMYEQQNQDAIGYFHADASESNFKTIVSNYKYIHIASHSIINESKPKLSAIIFSQQTDTMDKEDGILYAAEIYNLNLNADLVVLSSCESGIGKLVRGEGMMALTRGFLYAGASNIIVSLWKVHDRHTKALMIEIYKNILAGKSYSCALREAKLKMLDKGPKIWSSFVLIGGE
jgi:CHAT domain-containing protein/tetratricopeptide (TPR) repeat protein